MKNMFTQVSGRVTSPRILPGQPGGFNATCQKPHRLKLFILWTRAPGLFWKKIVHWSMYLQDYSSHMWCFLGKQKLCILSGRATLSPGRCFTIEWEPWALCYHWDTFLGGLFRELMPECRHEERGPKRAIAPMTPWVFMREISPRRLWNVQYYHSPCIHVFCTGAAHDMSSGTVLEQQLKRIFFNEYCYNGSSNIFLGKRTVSIIPLLLSTSSGEYVCGKEGGIFIFGREMWQVMRYCSLETPFWNHSQLGYTENTVNLLRNQ